MLKAAITVAICGTAATAAPAASSVAFAPSLPLASSGRSAVCTRRGGALSMAEGFGKDSPLDESTPRAQPSSEDDIRKVMEEGPKSSPGKGFGMEKFAGGEVIEKADEKRKAMQGRRQAPINIDGEAVFDVGWIKKAADVVLSDEWARVDEKGTDANACAECGGSGRLQGGLGVLPGLKWWPIKAFRPCPTCEAAGRAYNRRGQGLDEVLFGKDDMPMDYKKPADVGGISSADVKKIMAKTERKAKKDKGK